MKRMIHLAFLAFLLFPTFVSASNQSSSIGLGMGPLYYGIGANLTIPRKHSYNYLSIGCPEVGYGGDSGWITSCGVGYSIVTAEWSSNRKHGVGITTGVAYKQRYYGNGPSYSLGVSYGYFFNSIDNAGWNLQISPGYQYFNEDFSPMAILGFGYQF